MVLELPWKRPPLPAGQLGANSHPSLLAANSPDCVLSSLVDGSPQGVPSRELSLQNQIN